MEYGIVYRCLRHSWTSKKVFLRGECSNHIDLNHWGVVIKNNLGERVKSWISWHPININKNLWLQMVYITGWMLWVPDKKLFALISALKQALSDSLSYSLIKFQEVSTNLLLLSSTVSDLFLGKKKKKSLAHVNSKLKPFVYSKLSSLPNLMAGGVHSRLSRGFCSRILSCSTWGYVHDLKSTIRCKNTQSGRYTVGQ